MIKALFNSADSNGHERIYIAQSLDGYIAGPNDELDWLNEVDNPTGDDLGFAEFMDTVDALLMGRTTFETVMSFGEWPYTKPVYIASSQLNDIPSALAGKAFIVSGEITDLLEQLQNKGVQSLYIDGGQLIHQALSNNKVNQLIVTTIPVLLGAGKPLFKVLAERVNLELVSSEVLLGQLVKTHYRVLPRQQ